MLPDTTRFPVLGYLEEHFDTFRRESAALAESEWLHWWDTGACNQPWPWAPLVGHTLPHQASVDWDSRRALTPDSMRVLEARPEIVLATFSILPPGAHIHSHADLKPPGLLRAHLGLEVPAGRCALRVGDRLVRWQAGRTLIFEGKIDHETANFTDLPRSVMLVDFLTTEQEWSYACAQTERVDPRWLVSGAGNGLLRPEDLDFPGERRVLTAGPARGAASPR